MYIMILPAFGRSVRIFPAFSRKPLCSVIPRVLRHRRDCVSVIRGLAHTCSPLAPADRRAVLRLYFATLAIAVPTGSSLQLGEHHVRKVSPDLSKRPGLFAVPSLILFYHRGFSGLMLANRPGGLPVSQIPTFVVAPFHYVP